MEPFEIRTTPARLSPVLIVATVILLGVTVYLLRLGVQTTLLAARNVPDDPSRLVVCAALILVGYVMTWVYLRMYAPMVQVLCMYVFRDRGKRVVAYRLDGSGWRHVLAGSDVLVPWQGMTAGVTDRTDEKLTVTLRSDGPFVAARDPFSRKVRRDLRKERGLTIRLTTTDPTEAELASAIAAQSAGRVVLVR
jgi:hypothetical protein